MNQDMIEYRLDRIDANIDNIFKVLEGNGSAGMKGRLTMVESKQEQQEARWKWIFGIIAVIVAALIISFVSGCDGQDFRVEPVYQGSIVAHDGIIVSLDQVIYEGQTSTMTGLMFSGGIVADLIEQLPPGFNECSKSEKYFMVEHLLADQ